MSTISTQSWDLSRLSRSAVLQFFWEISCLYQWCQQCQKCLHCHQCHDWKLRSHELSWDRMRYFEIPWNILRSLLPFLDPIRSLDPLISIVMPRDLLSSAGIFEISYTLLVQDDNWLISGLQNPKLTFMWIAKVVKLHKNVTSVALAHHITPIFGLFLICQERWT